MKRKNVREGRTVATGWRGHHPLVSVLRSPVGRAEQKNPGVSVNVKQVEPALSGHLACNPAGSMTPVS